MTPSDHTAQVCKKLGLEIVDTKEVKEIEIAFDGCDQVGSDLNAYKSGGGIHTLEKIIAKMAKEYVLLVDETKVTDKLNNKITSCIRHYSRSSELCDKSGGSNGCNSEET